jgi:hypothetical protein
MIPIGRIMGAAGQQAVDECLEVGGSCRPHSGSRRPGARSARAQSRRCNRDPSANDDLDRTAAHKDRAPDDDVNRANDRLRAVNHHHNDDQHDLDDEGRADDLGRADNGRTDDLGCADDGRTDHDHDGRSSSPVPILGAESCTEPELRVGDRVSERVSQRRIFQRAARGVASARTRDDQRSALDAD